MKRNIFPINVAVIFGTRPEAIKLAPVILKLKEDRRFHCHVAVTAQHRQMLDQVLEIFSIKPDIDFDLMLPDQKLGGLTARTIDVLDKHFEAHHPDLVLVQGDTTTTFCAALAAFYHHIPVGHVEAGLRTWDLDAPWPEEANRVLTSRIATLHFAPTEKNRQNLLKEGIQSEHIFVTGNTVVDALFLGLQKTREIPFNIPGLPLGFLNHTDQRKLVLITGHRRESFGPAFEAICHAIAELARRFPEVCFVYPVHLNPNVQEPVNRILGKVETDNVFLLEPLAYLPFIALMSRAEIILTDSGGIQEEAPSLGKPVLVMRDTTERPEAVEAGTVKLVGADYDKILYEASKLLKDPIAYRSMSQISNPYGDGRAAERIMSICENFLISEPLN